MGLNIAQNAENVGKAKVMAINVDVASATQNTVVKIVQIAGDNQRAPFAYTGKQSVASDKTHCKPFDLLIT